jgi:hypothetical protein
MPGTILARPTILIVFGVVSLDISYLAVAQQVADPSYRPQISAPMHTAGQGARVAMDAGHNNFHTMDGLYQPFAALLAADGHIVQSREVPFTAASLANTDVLVIANALNEINVENPALPTPSAFTETEVDEIVAFVARGGGLFLIADQMPFPAAASTLAARFSIGLINGAINELDENGERNTGATVFKVSDGRIGDHAITRGRNAEESVQQIVTFNGSGFPATGDAISLIHFGENTLNLFPSVARGFENAPRAITPGWSQGVAIEYGDGRVVIFGEAAMFSSQQAGDSPPIGLTSPEGVDNELLLLNIVRWLSFDL